MKKIGITGGIGSGKSVVSNLFRLMGVPVYDADAESKRIVNVDQKVRAGLVSLFGSDIYSPNGQLDKPKLAGFIFTDKESLLQVNRLIHPAVSRDFFIWSDRQATSIVAIESAILFDSGFNRLVDVSINVSAPKEQCFQRVMLRDGISHEQVLNRVNNQMTDKQRNTLADCTILNDGIHPIIPQVVHILHMLL
ncbi:MAG: dephospho-CoA kinase [Bacteroidales bacterium]|jgi:dephospho-CoA kinase|nr:dephospho-CoA kinase [Bacteroidales bacterium]MDD3161248.1 dephospho-CoA kinase [Bacteroidales bacterium]